MSQELYFLATGKDWYEIREEHRKRLERISLRQSYDHDSIAYEVIDSYTFYCMVRSGAISPEVFQYVLSCNEKFTTDKAYFNGRQWGGSSSLYF